MFPACPIRAVGYELWAVCRGFLLIISLCRSSIALACIPSHLDRHSAMLAHLFDREEIDQDAVSCRSDSSETSPFDLVVVLPGSALFHW
ncbi:hypothetical protein BDR03DRAFT_952302 [Suillus americanus]|nr:hypothetical protein BDR03DRAFT_952302 [Suillus americanus]